MKKPYTIGITGGIGSGKTTVAQIFKSLDIPIFNSDECGKKLLKNNPIVINKIRHTFGDLTVQKKNINIDSLNEYDEIVAIGSGKGVVSVEFIKKPYWKRKSLKNYRILSKIYSKAVTNCPPYNG